MTDRVGDMAMLIKKHIANELTEIEKDQLTAWIIESEENQKVFDELTNEDSLQNALKDLFEFKQAHENTQDSPVVDLYTSNRGSNWIRIAAAAVIALVLGISYYLYTIKRNDQAAVVTNAGIKKTPQDITPGGNRAVLTLADGSTIILDNAQNGLIAEQDKTAISKTQDGELVYNIDPERSRRAQSPALSEVEGAIRFNTVTTPRGGQYQLTLPDGSKVWLNAASSIKFPVSFTGATRTVQLSGEAYFEVAYITLPGSAVRMPFEVQVNNGMKVQVLGTHFNVNSYGDDGRIRVTLLEGSVNVFNNRESVIIKPGQQTVAAPNSALTINPSPDLEQVMAWKEGRFYFDGTDITTVMHQLGRWYDLEVKNESNVSDIRIGGIISRNKNLSEVLKALELSDVHFRVEGKKLTLVP